MEKQNNKKIVFIDLDGTLMARGFKISQENINALNHAIDKGIDVVLLSGRPYKLVNYLAKKINENIKAIGFNGAYIEGLINETIDKELLKELLNFLNNHSDLILAKSIDCIYANKKPMETFVYPISDDQKVDVIVKKDLLNEVADKDIYKVLCIYRNAIDEKEICNYLEYKNINYCNYTGRGGEFVKPGIDKGYAAKKYLEFNKIDIRNAYFIGDDSNDIPMFKLGGHNIVMENGNEICKAYADFICPSIHENGVAFAIEKIIKEN